MAPLTLAKAKFFPLPNTEIEISVLQGNPKTGPSAIYMKFPANYAGSFHTHTHGYHGVLISGAGLRRVDGVASENATPISPGDYWYQAGGERHIDSYTADKPTIIYTVWEGPIDVSR